MVSVGEEMIRCKLCCIPDTRPDTEFVDGICSACLSFSKQPQIDWNARKEELVSLLDRHDGRCIVPSSGGKDSTWQVMTLLGLGADVTVVTATTCHLTPIGRYNIDNLSRYARTIEVSPNKTVRSKLNQLGLTLVGDISWPEHVSIFTTPFKMAEKLEIPLIFYGENPQNQYGGPLGSEEARTMTRRWVSEFGGFLGLRPSDMIGQDGIAKRDMEDYMPPHHLINEVGEETEAHFLGQYVSWDSHRNAQISMASGMRCELPCSANWWKWENQDNAQTGLHDHAMYRKYGYGRLCAQVSVDIRNGLMTREQGLRLVHERDGLFPEVYMGVRVDEVLDRIQMTRDELMTTLDKFTNWDLFDGVHAGRPLLKC
jgi:N-acetyl sugar amidotransferase